MPLSRKQVRESLMKVIEYQRTHAQQYGGLELAVWYAIEEQQQDVFLLEVFEHFVSLEGKACEVLRFPGIGELWLPGLYTLRVYSREEFEAALDGRGQLFEQICRQMGQGAAEVVWCGGEQGPRLQSLLEQCAR
jgi:hypothetical protein